MVLIWTEAHLWVLDNAWEVGTVHEEVYCCVDPSSGEGGQGRSMRVLDRAPPSLMALPVLVWMCRSGPCLRTKTLDLVKS